MYMRAKFIGIGSSIAALALPTLAFAQNAAMAQGIMGTLGLFNRVLNGLVGLFILLAILAVFWGLVSYLFKSGAEAKSDSIRMMIYGTVAIFFMVSIWGIIRLLQTTFGVTQNTSVTPAGIQSF